MRRLLSAIVLFACALSVYALHVHSVGVATMLVNEGDTLFVFADEPHLQTNNGVGVVTWYRVSDGSAYATAEDVYPDGDGIGLYIEVNGRREEFFVFDYREYEPQLTDLQATPFCRSTELNLTGVIPEMRYQRASGTLMTVERTCRVSYTDLAWAGEDWQDSAAVVDDLPLRIGTLQLPAVARATTFALSYEPIREQLGLERDSIVSAEMTPIAVRSNPTSTATVRGGASPLPGSNEVERPAEAGALRGSAPLDILFRSHPTPAVDYFRWYIYRANSLLVQRMDEDTRYTFTEPGNYRVVCYVSNNACPCADKTDGDCEVDSTEFTISVSESQLLVPNVFTPNGDGVNDEFRVQYRSLREFHCWIYNRWGHLVYEWTDPAKGWDGTINGRPAAEGAYFYVIRAMGTDAAKNAEYVGKVSYQKKQLKADEAIIGVYQLSGDINLLRGAR